MESTLQIQQAIHEVIAGHDLSAQQMREVMHAIMAGEATQAQIGGFLVALRMKQESIEEIAAAAEVMRELATRVQVDSEHLVDTCGTGGDGARTFNISTAAAFVIAGAGGRVAKHGNRSVSSSSGSADVLEALGVAIDLAPAAIARCIDEAGVGFLFAPAHHRATRHAVAPRRELGVRTIFNVLGPLTNPALAPNQVIGVYQESLVEPMARALGLLGSRHVLVVHGSDGLDELTITGSTRVAELRGGEVNSYQVTPEQFGLARGDVDSLIVETPQQSAALIERVLAGTVGPARDVVALNAGAGIYVAGLAGDFAAGVERALDSIDSGAARARLERLRSLSRALHAEQAPR